WAVKCFSSSSSSGSQGGRKSLSLVMAKAVGTAVRFSPSSLAGASMAIWASLVSLSLSFTYFGRSPSESEFQWRLSSGRSLRLRARSFDGNDSISSCPCSA
ncbi:hypothetical protein A2U01_0065740, partial [Trifolium medium]|nr:hypothetical protein [Trifolium medium]